MGNAPRLSDFMGYTALTSGPNEQPRWGHYLSTYMDECQERFEAWLEEHDQEIRDSMRPLDSAPKNDEEDYDPKWDDVHHGEMIW